MDAKGIVAKRSKPKLKGIKSWPQEDRPREKLLKKGARNLSNSELLAILLRTGTHGVSAIDLARKVLKKFGIFRNMAHTDVRDWKEFKGLGDAKIAHIQAALEIGRRFREDEASAGKQKISSAKDIVDILMPQLRDLKTEVFKVVYLDSNNRIIISWTRQSAQSIMPCRLFERSFIWHCKNLLSQSSARIIIQAPISHPVRRTRNLPKN